jgi:hypothetical protein
LLEVDLSVDLERIDQYAFNGSRCLKRIALPLKDTVFNSSDDNILNDCDELVKLDIVGNVHETIAMFGLESVRNKMNEEMKRINREVVQNKVIAKVIKSPMKIFQVLPYQ